MSKKYKNTTVNEQLFTDEQKIAYKIQKLKPKAVLSGSKNMMNVQKVIVKMQQSNLDQLNISKKRYLSPLSKEESKLNKPLYTSQLDLMRKKIVKRTSEPKAGNIDFYAQELVSSPLITKEFEDYNEQIRTKKNLNDLMNQANQKDHHFDIQPTQPEPFGFFFPPQPEMLKEINDIEGFSSKRYRKSKLDRQGTITQRFISQLKTQNFSQKSKLIMSSSATDLWASQTPEIEQVNNPQAQFENEMLIKAQLPIQSNVNQIKDVMNNQVTSLQDKKINIRTANSMIISEEKLIQFEEDKKKIDNQVIRRLGMMSELDRKLLRIQELQARALKMRIKLNKNQIYQLEQPSLQNKVTSTKLRRVNTSCTSPFSKSPQGKTSTHMYVSQTSPKAASEFAGILQQNHFKDQINQNSSNFTCATGFKSNRPKTEETKRRIMGFCDNLCDIQKQQRYLRIQDADEVVSTIGIIKNELQNSRKNLLDKNDILELDILNQIKEQVITYSKEHKLKLIRFT